MTWLKNRTCNNSFIRGFELLAQMKSSKIGVVHNHDKDLNLHSIFLRFLSSIAKPARGRYDACSAVNAAPSLFVNVLIWLCFHVVCFCSSLEGGDGGGWVKYKDCISASWRYVWICAHVRLCLRVYKRVPALECVKNCACNTCVYLYYAQNGVSIFAIARRFNEIAALATRCLLVAVPHQLLRLFRLSKECAVFHAQDGVQLGFILHSRKVIKSHRVLVALLFKKLVFHVW